VHREPSRILAAVNAAVTATLALVALVTGMSDELRLALDVCLAAWLVVAGELVRRRVAPEASVEKHDLRVAEALWPYRESNRESNARANR
jgi:hypothetical protein